tara:strand:- start:3457 stop:3756 length:300 start_codon:yes stop_codon:yes gene_type:complete
MNEQKEKTMKPLLYQPLASFEHNPEKEAFIVYASANLQFFQADWLNQFQCCSALANLWPGEKIKGICKQLQDCQDLGIDCYQIFLSYSNIYQRLTQLPP